MALPAKGGREADSDSPSIASRAGLNIREFGRASQCRHCDSSEDPSEDKAMQRMMTLGAAFVKRIAFKRNKLAKSVM